MAMPAVPPPAPLLGIFAGGRGLRMGGRDKAQLPAPLTGEPLQQRLLGLGERLGIECVVVGGAGHSEVFCIADEPAGIGPIGGLCALLTHAGNRAAIALACDLPYLDMALLGRLVSSPSAAAVLSARDPATGKWQPMFARYDSPRVLPALRVSVADGVRSFQTFLRGLEVEELPLAEEERALLRDWDSPSDMEA
jgi:molybdopterin-guanine dinucleotide biosynthesis protein A